MLVKGKAQDALGSSCAFLFVKVYLPYKNTASTIQISIFLKLRFCVPFAEQPSALCVQFVKCVVLAGYNPSPVPKHALLVEHSLRIALNLRTDTRAAT